MAQTKADRQAAAKKGAATRERNKKRAQSQKAGTKGAAKRQSNEASASAKQAKQSAVGGVTASGALARRRGRVGRQVRGHPRARRQEVAQATPAAAHRAAAGAGSAQWWW